MGTLERTVRRQSALRGPHNPLYGEWRSRSMETPLSGFLFRLTRAGGKVYQYLRGQREVEGMWQEWNRTHPYAFPTAIHDLSEC